MRVLRPSLISLSFVGTLWLAASAGCGSSASDPPGSNVDAGGGTGGTGGTGGSGGTGFIDAPVDMFPSCADPTDETDSDGDGIADQIEGEGDADGDGTPNKLDEDSDDDGIPDSVEAENKLLPMGARGQNRVGPCSGVANSDADDEPDYLDFDADGDGVLDDDELTTCADCRVLADCDEDTVIDIVEEAAESDICDANDVPADSSLYFIVPYQEPEKTRDFDFSTGIKDADIYFMVDTTSSMQPAIDNIKNSLNSTIIPTILNGDSSKGIPAIPGAYIGIGTFKDVPWAPWGLPQAGPLPTDYQGDYLYRDRFCIGGTYVFTGGSQATYNCVGGTVVNGRITEPKVTGTTFEAPDNVSDILNGLTAAGGNDSPESTTQALFMASTTDQYAATAGGLWRPFDADCPANRLGRACFRPGRLPIFVLISDAAFHNGPQTQFDYVQPPMMPPTGTAVGGVKTYAAVVDALNSIGGKIVGIPVDTGTPGQARNDMRDLATKTDSVFFDPQFGGSTKPLVTEQDTTSGDVSTEVVELIGLLAGFGLNNVTTDLQNYDCPGGIDCDGDGVVDPEYHNFPDQGAPFDATQLIKAVRTIESPDPKPYASRNDSTFFGVRGDATVEFEVVAENTILQPQSLLVVQAILRVQTPSGQALGGADGIKRIYLVIPRFRPKSN